MATSQNSGGFTLTEVLVAVFVLSVGIIGSLAMQLHALRAVRESSLHSAALALAVDLAERMRSHERQPGAAPDPFLQIDYRAIDDAGAAPDTNCYGSQCSPDQLAAFDIHEWEQRLAASLPDGRARICRDASPWDRGADAYRWECDDADGEPLVIKIGWRGTDANPGVALMVRPYDDE